jgi:hypothetical protein
MVNSESANHRGFVENRTGELEPPFQTSTAKRSDDYFEMLSIDCPDNTIHLSLP